MALPKAEDYDALGEVEHVLKRPSTFVGSIEKEEREEWVYDVNECKARLMEVEIPEGMERTFLELLSNAADNTDKSRRNGIDLGRIEVLMDRKSISIRNEGAPIPTSIHPKEGIHTPQLIFGTMRTSSTYKEQSNLMVCGQNGFGAKLTNIFSINFMIIIGNAFEKKKYTQVWRNNMSPPEDPIIEDYEGESYTQIVYDLDFPRFGYEEYPDEAFHVFALHVANVSSTCKVESSFNGINMDFRDFEKYCAIFPLDTAGKSFHYQQWPKGTNENDKKSWKVLPTIEMAVFDTPFNGKCVSLVNSIITREGGVHVNEAFNILKDNIVGFIQREDKKKDKDKKEKEKKEKKVKINIMDTKRHLSLLLNCRLPNPKFNSQTKGLLKSPKPKFKIPSEMLSAMQKWNVINRLFIENQAKLEEKLAEETDGKKTRNPNIPGTSDAYFAGGCKSHQCTAFCVEGRSAFGYAEKFIKFMEEGYDYSGIFPFRGKLINVMNADTEKLRKNKEIEKLKRFLGLQEDKDYSSSENYKTLRYGHLIILTDADPDGDHIKGLIMNYFYCRFPSLLSRGYIMYMRTPLLRVFKGAQCMSFFSKHDYNVWHESIEDANKWQTKYFKGLGTSTKENVREDFKDPKYVMCIYDQLAPNYFHLAFDKRMAMERKAWLQQWKDDTEISSAKTQNISEFFDKEFINFSWKDVLRSIPGPDGLKPSQRKIVWVAMKILKKNQEIKVAQLGPKVASEVPYDHGEENLNSTIIDMARDFIGSNNMPFFVPKGDFGSRNFGTQGKSAAPRYIFTKLQWWVPYIYVPEDKEILKPQYEDGDEAEPMFLLPILPIHMINGTVGIGTGYSTRIPPHHPLDLSKWVRARLTGEELPVIFPWFRHFKGEIQLVKRTKDEDKEEDGIDEVKEGEDPEEIIEKEDNEDEEDEIDEVKEEDHDRWSLQARGKYEIGDRGTVTISELPVGRWTQTYVELLGRWQQQGRLRDFRKIKIEGKKKNEEHGDDPVGFKINGFRNPSMKNLKLIKNYNISNMCMLDEFSKPEYYPTTVHLLEKFYQFRLGYFEIRRDHVVNKMKTKIADHHNRANYIKGVLDGIIILGRPAEEIKAAMEILDIPEDIQDVVKGRNFTREKIEELYEKINTMSKEMEEYTKLTQEQIWYSELLRFEEAYTKHYGNDRIN